MSLPSEQSTASYVGNNSTSTPYPIPYKFYVPEDIVVTVIDAAGEETVLTLNSQYTIAGGDVSAGATGSMKTVAAVPGTSKVRLDRTVTLDQETVFTGIGAFPSASVDRALDRGVMMAQQLQREIDRAAETTDGNDTLVKLRRDTAANWTSLNPVLMQGEVGIELAANATKPHKIKIGDGLTPWNSLIYTHEFLGHPVQNGFIIYKTDGTQQYVVAADLIGYLGVQNFALLPLASPALTVAGSSTLVATSPAGVKAAIDQAVFASGGLLVASQSQSEAGNSTTSALSPAGGRQAELARLPAPLQQVMQMANTGIVRLVLGGTSIENFANSGVNLALEAAKAQYGDAGVQRVYLASIGGNYIDPYLGWEKQSSGSIQFRALRGNSSSSTLTVPSGYGARIVIKYEKQSGGSTCDVKVDGVTVGTIDCGGSQSYGNEFVYNTTLGPHSVSILPPASGYVYLSTIEYHPLNKTGIDIINCTLGGSALRHLFQAQLVSSPIVTAIPIVGNNAVDGIFRNTAANSKPNLAIVAWCVNDATNVSDINTYYIPELARIVADADAVGYNVVLIVEMGGHLEMPTDPSYAAYEAIKAAIRAWSSHPRVTVLDWSGATKPAYDINAYIARYYPDYPGNGIHPTPEGHSVVEGMLATALGVRTIGNQGVNADDVARQRLGASPVSPIGTTSATAMLEAAKTSGELELTNSFGQPLRYRPGGTSQNLVLPFAAPPETVWRSTEEISYDTTLLDAIASAPTGTDSYGSYKTYTTNTGMYMALPSVPNGTPVTITFMVRGESAYNMSVIIRNQANTASLAAKVAGVDFSTASGGFVNIGSVPKLVHVIFVPNGELSSLVVITGSFYGAWVTPTAFPCLPQRSINNELALRGPLVMVADIPAASGVVGTTYLETINSKTIEKICLGRNVYRPTTGTYTCLYRLGNRSTVDLKILPLSSPTSTPFSARFGSYIPTDSSGSPSLASAAFTPTPLATYTLTGLNADGVTAVYLNQGGTFLDLKTDMTWQTRSGGPINLIGSNFAARNAQQLAFTFQMPSSAMLGGSPWQLVVRRQAGATSNLPWVLCEGSSATIP